MPLYYIGLGINIVLILVLVYIILVFLLPPVMGAPFVPSSQAVVERMIALANIKPGERMVDLGSGDGRIVIAFAEKGIEAHGYEINPLLVFWSRLSIHRRGLRKLAHIHWKSFRACDFSKFNIITIYGLIGIMASLEKKLQSQMPDGGRVVSHVFRFPNWPPTEKQDKVYLYEKREDLFV